LGTLDFVTELPDYSGGVKILWKSAESRSDNFISYHYINFHNDACVHSLLLSSSVNIYRGVYLNFAYNHLFYVGDNDKDLYGAGIMLKF
jgi:hypothetical protein